MAKFNLDELRTGEPNPFVMYLFFMSFILIYPFVLYMTWIKYSYLVLVFFFLGVIAIFLTLIKIIKERR